MWPTIFSTLFSFLDQVGTVIFGSDPFWFFFFEYLTTGKRESFMDLKRDWIFFFLCFLVVLTLFSILLLVFVLLS